MKTIIEPPKKDTQKKDTIYTKEFYNYIDTQVLNNNPVVEVVSVIPGQITIEDLI